MDIATKIEADYKEAMMAHDEKKVGLLRLVRAAFKNELINLRKKTLEQDEVLAVLKKEAKKRKEAIEIYKKSSRVDLAENEQLELSYLANYLPAMMSEEDIKKIINAKIQSLGATVPADFGKVMPLVMAELKNQADGQTVNSLVRAALANI